MWSIRHPLINVHHRHPHARLIRKTKLPPTLKSHSHPSSLLLPIALLSSSSSGDLAAAGTNLSPSFRLRSSFLGPPKSWKRASLSVLALSTLSRRPWRRCDSFCQLIWPPSASRCFCAFSFAAWIDVRE